MLVVTTLGAPSRRRRRRTRPRKAEPGGPPDALPLTRVTVVSPRPLGDAASAARWLDRAGREPEATEAMLRDALRVVNRALRTHAAAAQDPYVHEVSADAAVAVRIGYGEGERVADGQWAEARNLERAEPRRRRSESLRPQERVAAVLGGRERTWACETLLLRARLDLDTGNTREAAPQLRAALAALLAELGPGAGSRVREDLDAVRARHDEVGALADAALRGDLEADAETALREVLARCERALRRARLRA